MAFLVSPGVEVKEIDLTGIIPAVSTSIGAYAGRFSWGPVGDVVNVSSEKDLARNFGTPDKSLAQSYFLASSFLRYSNALLVSRAVDSAAKNAASGDTPDSEQIKNLDDFEGRTSTSLTSDIYARYPGALGNSLKVMFQKSGVQSRVPITAIAVADDGTGTDVVTLTLTVDDAVVGDTGLIADGQEIALRNVDASGDLIEALRTTRLYIGEADCAADGVVTAVLYTDAAESNVFDATDYTNTTFTSPGGFIYAPVETQDFEDSFLSAPNTSTYAETYDVENDEIHVLIVDEKGLFTGTPGTILEAYNNVSLGTDGKKENGETNYYKDVVNRSSQYIYINKLSTITETESGVINAGAAFTFTGDGSVEIYQLSGGIDAGANTNGIFEALEYFADTERFDVNFVFAENDVAGATAVANKLITIAENRKDCVAFISPWTDVKDKPTEDQKLDRVIEKFDGLPSTSYAVFDSSPLYIYDKYNDQYIWIDACGSVAGLCAYTDNVRDPWWSPAGYNRGQLKGVTKIGYNPKQSHRDELYKARVNPIVTFPGEGTILFGDKTAQKKASAFDRINVRRLFIVLEKAIATAAKYQLFEFNDEFTRAQFRNMVNPYLRDVQGRRGITDFIVICDETNNTGEVIDANRFVADIYIKPARAINFITLNFIATRTGVEFSEVIGQF
jgi:phage tail sheath protein FI